MLSSAELDLTDQPKLSEFLAKQIESAIRDTAVVAARFKSNGNTMCSELIYSLLGDLNNLVTKSQELASNLYAAIDNDQRITAGCLLVCVFTASNYNGICFLALMKVDPSEVFIQRIREEPGGKVIEFEPRDNVLTTGREKLQKAALIHPHCTQWNYEILMLDKQVSAVAANFFAQDFLHAEAMLDDGSRTKGFYTGAMNAYNELYGAPKHDKPRRLTQEKAEYLHQQIDAVMHTQRVEIDGWIENLDLPVEAKQVLQHEIQKKVLVDRAIHLDAKTVAKLTKKRRYRGPYGLVIEVEADRFDDVVKTEIINRDGDQYTVITITVKDSLIWVRV